MRTVRLYGELGRRFGRSHQLDVATPAEAVRALVVNHPGFEQALRDHPHGFHVLAGRDDRGTVVGLRLPAGEAESIRIIPAVAGGKSAFGRILVGALLIGAAFFTGVASLGAGGLVFSGLAGQLAVGIGASLVLGGVSQLLAPTPKYQAASDDDTQPSYVFSGPTNTSAQGTAVPVGYGRFIVGSSVVSLGLTVQELPT
jgi:predicted phage tail protein